MICVIQCNTCGEVLGQIEKPEITAEDIQVYRQMVVCSSGHSEVLLEEINDV